MEIYNIQTAEVDIFLKRRDTVNISLDVTLNGDAYDMSTAQEIIWAIATFDGVQKKVIKLTDEDSAITVSTNTLEIVLPEGLDFYGTFKHDLEVKDADDNVYTVMEGKVIISNDISHAVSDES